MKEEFEKLVTAGKIEKQHVERLVVLAESGYCMHKSWGFGRIASVDTVFGRFSIDFLTKAGHSLDLIFAADSLKAITKDHILARKMSDLAALRQMAALHHLDLIKLVLQSFGGRATMDQIQQVLVPDVITSDWKKWWDAAKSEMKKDGHYMVPLKKSEAIVYQAKEVSLQDRLLKEFREGKGLKVKVATANEVLKSIDDLTNKNAAVTEIITSLNTDIAAHLKNQPALALEGIFVRDELRETTKLAPQENEPQAMAVWSQSLRLVSLLEQIPAAKHKRTLLSYQTANPDLWHEALLGILNQVPSKVCGEITTLLISSGKLDKLKETLTKLISQHQASSELLLWLARERSDSFADILGPEVFRATLTAIERDQFNEKKSNRLRDFVMDDQELIVELIESADLDVIKDLVRALQLSASFDDMDKRSLLGRIVKTYPQMQSLITGDQAKQEATLVVSWDSLERRKAEYDELVHKKVPANSKEIAIARSYGDLRENHEYKAAKEMQKVLMRRKAELERDLSRARGTDYANPKTDVVSIGTRVQVTDLGNKQKETFTVLGAWDGDPDKGIISYLTPIGQALLNKPTGAETEYEMEGVKKSYRIDSIDSYKS